MPNLKDEINSRTNQVTLEGTRTNWVDETVIGLSGSPSINNVNNFQAQCSVDKNGQYHLDFSFGYETSSSSTSHTTTFANVTFKTGTVARTQFSVAGSVVTGSAYPNSTNTILSTVGNSNVLTMFGTIPLESKPSWFDDNLQTSGGLPLATATSPGVTYKGNKVAYRLFSGISSGTGHLDYSAVATDILTTVGTWSNSSGQITIPRTGTYSVNMSVQHPGTPINTQYRARVNGGDIVTIYMVPDSGSQVGNGSLELDLSSGDIFSIYLITSGNANIDTENSWLTLREI